MLSTFLIMMTCFVFYATLVYLSYLSAEHHHE